MSFKDKVFLFDKNEEAVAIISREQLKNKSYHILSFVDSWMPISECFIGFYRQSVSSGDRRHHLGTLTKNMRNHLEKNKKGYGFKCY